MAFLLQDRRRAFLEEMRKLAKMLTRRPIPIIVMHDYGAAYMDHKALYINLDSNILFEAVAQYYHEAIESTDEAVSKKALKEARNQVLACGKGLVDHECAHFLYTSSEEWDNCIQAAQYHYPAFAGLIKDWLNLYEDARINRCMAVEFPGSKRFIRGLYYWMMVGQDETYEEMFQHMHPVMQLRNETLECVMTGKKPRQMPTPELDSILYQLIELGEKVRRASLTQHAAVAAFQAFELLKPMLPDPQEYQVIEVPNATPGTKNPRKAPSSDVAGDYRKSKPIRVRVTKKVSEELSNSAPQQLGQPQPGQQSESTEQQGSSQSGTEENQQTSSQVSGCQPQNSQEQQGQEQSGSQGSEQSQQGSSSNASGDGGEQSTSGDEGETGDSSDETGNGSSSSVASEQCEEEQVSSSESSDENGEGMSNSDPQDGDGEQSSGAGDEADEDSSESASSSVGDGVTEESETDETESDANGDTGSASSNMESPADEDNGDEATASFGDTSNGNEQTNSSNESSQGDRPNSEDGDSKLESEENDSCSQESQSSSDNSSSQSSASSNEQPSSSNVQGTGSSSDGGEVSNQSRPESSNTSQQGGTPDSTSTETGEFEEDDTDEGDLSDEPENFDDLEQVIEGMLSKEQHLERVEREKQEAQEQSELREISSSLHVGEIHQDIKIHTPIVKSKLYDSTDIEKDMNRVIPAMESDFQQLLDKRKRKWSKPQYSGSLDRRKMLQEELGNDRIFRQKNNKKLPELVVVVITDESGSMEADDETGMHRFEAATGANYLLHHILRSLNVPHQQFGFSAKHGYPAVVHRPYVLFENCMEENLPISCGHFENARDGLSIRVAAETLRQRPERDKLLIVISDGMPYHPCGKKSFTDEKAVLDTRQAVEEAEADGVRVVGVSIGDNDGHMPLIYPNRACVRQLKQLPSKLVDILTEMFQ